MDGDRRVYELKINFNARDYDFVVIDPHYEEKHNDLDDSVILRVVMTITGMDSSVDDQSNGFQYFSIDDLKLEGKLYRLIVCVPDDHSYVGVVNCYRR